jgi:succinyl-CoA synthetase beta subunit
LHGRVPGWTGAVPGRSDAAPGWTGAAPASAEELIPPGEVEALLREAGLPVLCSREVDSAPAARSAAESLGYPVVVKVSRALHRGTHRVRLGLHNADDVAAAYDELAPQGPILVQRQAAAGLEFYVGVRADPVFGRLLLVGAGGPRVEELADIAIAREPLEPGRIGELVAATLAGRWLASPASRALLDLGSLTQVAEKALRAFAQAPGLESLDLNPVVVNQVGATVVDAKASGRRPRPATVAREVSA